MSTAGDRRALPGALHEIIKALIIRVEDQLGRQLGTVSAETPGFREHVAKNKPVNSHEALFT